VCLGSHDDLIRPVPHHCKPAEIRLGSRNLRVERLELKALAGLLPQLSEALQTGAPVRGKRRREVIEGIWDHDSRHSETGDCVFCRALALQPPFRHRSAA
jgi:hypothetical protein